MNRSVRHLTDGPPQLVRPPEIRRPRLSIGPHRAARTEEMFLVWLLAGTVLHRWELLSLDPLAALELSRSLSAGSLCAGLISEADRDWMKEAAAEIDQTAHDRPEPAEISMLLAQMVWFCNLILPIDADDLWFGPPVVSVDRMIDVPGRRGAH